MNKRMNNIARAYLTARYGPYCAGCRVSELQKLLEVDHKDNNNNNNNPNNWQFLCYRCNYLKNPRLAERIEPLDSVCGGVWESVNEIISTPRESEISINREKEPLFRKYVEYTVKELGQVSQQDLINGGAEYCECSTKTTTRYLAKLTSPVGKYVKFKKDNRIMVCLKDTEELI